MDGYYIRYLARRYFSRKNSTEDRHLSYAIVEGLFLMLCI